MSVAALCVAAPAFAEDLPGNAGVGQSSTAPTSPLWLVSCSNQARPDQLLCEFSQSIVATQGNQTQRLATATFVRVSGAADTSAVVLLPHGVSLTEPVRVLVDGREVGSLAWRSCDAGGCHAGATVDDPWLQSMRSGVELSAAFKTADGRDLSFAFQLNGFTQADDLLP